jgi:hypothetical protein
MKIVSEHYFTARDGRRSALNEGTYYGVGRTHLEDEELEALDLIMYCVLVTDEGYAVTGAASCVDPSVCDEEACREVAKENAMSELRLIEELSSPPRLNYITQGAWLVTPDTTTDEMLDTVVVGGTRVPDGYPEYPLVIHVSGCAGHREREANTRLIGVAPILLRLVERVLQKGRLSSAETKEARAALNFVQNG